MIAKKSVFSFLQFNSSKTFQCALLAAVVISSNVFAASFNLTGNYRFGGQMLVNPDLQSGVPNGQGNTTSFLEHRFLLRPDVVVDDRFTLKSELSFLQNTSNAPNDVGEGFGTPLDRSSTQFNNENTLYVRRAYMEWASDWGIFRAGRQPKSWGLGILYNAGNDPLDDYGTTVDRIGYQAMLGNLTLNAGFEKGREGFVKNDADDIETYEMSLEYNNPESLFDVGILYARNIRSGSSLLASSHDLSIFTQKKWEHYQLGGEFVSIRQAKRSSTMGLLAQFDYLHTDWDLGLDLAYASASNDANFVFHPNYQPFLMMFRQSLGPNAGRTVRGGANGAGVGTAVGTGDGSGALLTKASLARSFSNKTYTLGFDLGYAKLMRTGTNSGDKLGFETDLHLTQKWYENFSTQYAMGFLFPGSGYAANPKIGWGVQLRGVLSF